MVVPGKNPNPGSVYRWHRHGLRGHYLECVNINGALFSTREALFTRTLRPGARPIDAPPEALVSPADGRVAATGITVDGRVEVAPGRRLDLRALLAHEPGPDAKELPGPEPAAVGKTVAAGAD
jgi:phosphatidylserine decarboxylase